MRLILQYVGKLHLCLVILKLVKSQRLVIERIIKFSELEHKIAVYDEDQEQYPYTYDNTHTLMTIPIHGHQYIVFD